MKKPDVGVAYRPFWGEGGGAVALMAKSSATLLGNKFRFEG